MKKFVLLITVCFLIMSGGVPIVWAADLKPGWQFLNINYKEAQKILGNGNADVKIAVIDSGINCAHPALEGGVRYHYDAFLNTEAQHTENCTWDIKTISAHGTHVAGTIAGKNMGGIQIGIANGVSLYDFKCLDEKGMEGRNTIAKSIDKAIEKGVDIINLSLGSEMYNEDIDASVRRAVANGILVVAASGNSNQNVLSQPADVYGVITVNASNDAGRTWFSNYGWETDITAPGQDIYSSVVNETDMQYISNDKALGEYSSLSGTSMAAPMVSGSAALIKSYYLGFKAEDIRNILYESAKKPKDYSEKAYGKGLLDLNAAAKTAEELKTAISNESGIVASFKNINPEYKLAKIYNTFYDKANNQKVTSDKCVEFEFTLKDYKDNDFAVVSVRNSAGNSLGSETLYLTDKPEYKFYSAGLPEDKNTCYMAMSLSFDKANLLGSVRIYYDYDYFSNYFDNGNYEVKFDYHRKDEVSTVFAPFNVIEPITDFSVSAEKLNKLAENNVKLEFNVSDQISALPDPKYPDILLLLADFENPRNINSIVWSQTISETFLEKGAMSVDVAIPVQAMDKITSSKATFMLARGNASETNLGLLDQFIYDIEVFEEELKTIDASATDASATNATETQVIVYDYPNIFGVPIIYMLAPFGAGLLIALIATMIGYRIKGY